MSVDSLPNRFDSAAAGMILGAEAPKKVTVDGRVGLEFTDDDDQVLSVAVDKKPLLVDQAFTFLMCLQLNTDAAFGRFASMSTSSSQGWTMRQNGLDLVTFYGDTWQSTASAEMRGYGEPMVVGCVVNGLQFKTFTDKDGYTESAEQTLTNSIPTTLGDLHIGRNASEADKSLNRGNFTYFGHMVAGLLAAEQIESIATAMRTGDYV